MTYRELFYKAVRLINDDKITLGEYDEMTKPLDREIEQKPIFDKIRAEIEQIYGEIDTVSHNEYENAVEQGKEIAYENVLDIIDKYKAESEDKE